MKNTQDKIFDRWDHEAAIREKIDSAVITDEKYYEALCGRKSDVDDKGNPEYIDCITMFDARQAGSWLREGKNMPEMRWLIPELWVEGEVACLFADSNVGKSILAVQWAQEIAKKQRVLYFDFEMSTRQFTARYSAPDGTLMAMESNFYRAEIDPGALHLQAEGDVEDQIISQMTKVMETAEAEVMIIDNLTYLCLESESGDAAGRLMMRLMQLKQLNGWSVMVLAHTPKRDTTQPLSANDLAGSKRLFNFFDTVIAVGKCATGDDDLRYLKQLKVRSGRFTFTEHSVQLLRITKTGANLHMEPCGTSGEFRLISRQSKGDRTRSTITDLLDEGHSPSEIAKKLGVTPSYVYKVIKAQGGTSTADSREAS